MLVMDQPSWKFSCRREDSSGPFVVEYEQSEAVFAFSVVFQLLVLNEDRFTVEYLVMEFPNWDR